MQPRHAIRTTLLGIVLVSSLALTACTGTPSTNSGCGPCYGGQIRDAIVGDPASLFPELSGDAFAGQVQQAIWAPLFYTDDQRHILAGLASEVPTVGNGGFSADGKTITIHLRPGLKWSDGQSLTADDVVFTINLFQQSPSKLQNGFQASEIASASATDAGTVQITLNQPDATFLLLSLTNSAVFTPLPQHTYDGMSLSKLAGLQDNNVPPVISGPFMVTARQPGAAITVSRNPHYYLAPRPYLDKIVFVVVGNATQQLLALKSGAVDVASLLSPSDFSQLGSLSGIKPVVSGNPNAFEALWLNQTSPILQDPVIRLALATSIDPHTEIQQIRQGVAFPTCDDSVGTFAHEPSLITSAGFCAYGPDGKTYDSAAAEHLLDQDGWTMGNDGFRHKNGQTLSVRLSVNAGAQYRLQSEQIIAEQWRAIGVQTVMANYTDRTVLFPATQPSSSLYDVAEIEWFVGPDPDSRSLWESTETPPMMGNNLTFYSNPQVDMWERQQATDFDQANRAALFHLIHLQLLKDIPLIYLYAAPDICGACVQLHNYRPSSIYGASETWNVQDWWYPTGNAKPSSSTGDILGSVAIPIYGSCRGS